MGDGTSRCARPSAFFVGRRCRCTHQCTGRCRVYFAPLINGNCTDAPLSPSPPSPYPFPHLLPLSPPLPSFPPFTLSLPSPFLFSSVPPVPLYPFFGCSRQREAKSKQQQPALLLFQIVFLSPAFSAIKRRGPGSGRNGVTDHTGSAQLFRGYGRHGSAAQRVGRCDRGYAAD